MRLNTTKCKTLVVQGKQSKPAQSVTLKGQPFEEWYMVQVPRNRNKQQVRLEPAMGASTPTNKISTYSNDLSS